MIQMPWKCTMGKMITCLRRAVMMKDRVCHLLVIICCVAMLCSVSAHEAVQFDGVKVHQEYGAWIDDSDLGMFIFMENGTYLEITHVAVSVGKWIKKGDGVLVLREEDGYGYYAYISDFGLVIRRSDYICAYTRRLLYGAKDFEENLRKEDEWIRAQYSALTTNSLSLGAAWISGDRSQPSIITTNPPPRGAAGSGEGSARTL